MSLKGENRSREQSESKVKSIVNESDENRGSNFDEGNLKHGVVLGISEHMENATPAKENGEKLNSNVSDLVNGRDHLGSPSIKSSSSNSSSPAKEFSSLDVSLSFSSSTLPPDDGLPPLGKNVNESRNASSSPASKVGANGISQSHHASKSRNTNNGFANQSVTFAIPDFIPESHHGHVATMMQSPPMQAMDRSSAGGEGYDPLRIPSAVFESNKTSPVDWSIASNDSLFSLQLAPSFSRDRHTAEVDSQVSSSSPVSVVDNETRVSAADADNQPSVPIEERREEITEIEKSEEAAGVADETTSKDATKPGDVEYPNEKKKKKSAGSVNSESSDESGESDNSFAFPV